MRSYCWKVFLQTTLCSAQNIKQIKARKRNKRQGNDCTTVLAIDIIELLYSTTWQNSSKLFVSYQVHRYRRIYNRVH